MKGYIQIAHRATGKTSRAVYEFMKDPQNSMLIVANNRMVRDVLNKVEREFKLSDLELESLGRKIIPFSEQLFRGTNNKKVIFDEFFSFEKRQHSNPYQIWKELIELVAARAEEIYIFTTHDQLNWRINKSGKKFVKFLVKKCGFRKMPNVRTSNPEVIRINKELRLHRKLSELTEKAEKIGYRLVKINEPVYSGRKNDSQSYTQLSFNFEPKQPKQQRLFD